MLKRTVVAVAAGFLLTGVVSAQETKPAPQPTQQPETKQESPARRENQPINVKVDLTLTDQIGPGQAGKKTVSMIVADGHDGSIRTGGTVLVDGGTPGTGAAIVPAGSHRVNVTLNVDARPAVLDDNRIRLGLSVEYMPKPATEPAGGGEGRPHLIERMTLIVTPGKPIVVSQASDPTTDRRITVELTTTILK
jgi:hypothetical protein